MTYDQILDHFGNGMAAAEALGYTHQAVYAWQRNGVPARVQRLVEMVTGGKLKADARGAGIAGRLPASMTKQ